MSGFLAGLLALSVKGALVAVVVALVLATGGRRLLAALRHGLWFLVFVRLALPALPASPASLFSRAPAVGAAPGTAENHRSRESLERIREAGVRSPGRDGVFEGTTYAAGAYPVSDLDRDVVWIDGYFVTWPSKKAE